MEDATIDTVVSTFTLCTVPGVVEAIRGIGRVLRPGGKFIFFEHGLHRIFEYNVGSDGQSPFLTGYSKAAI